MRKELMKEEAKRIFERSIKPRLVLDPRSKCWNFTGYTARGYGQVSSKSELFLAHRVSYLAFSDLSSLPLAYPLVCHSCDNRSCCNPEHLFLGDHSINMKDAADKGFLSGRRKLSNKEDEVWCSRCKKFLPKEEFYRSSRHWTGLQTHCRKCGKEIKELNNAREGKVPGTESGRGRRAKESTTSDSGGESRSGGRE